MKGMIHDLWCFVTRRCQVRLPTNDPYIRWMREQERASIAARRARRNFIEAELLERLPHHERGGHAQRD